MEFRPQRQWQIQDPSGRRKYITGDERRRLLATADGATPQVRTLVYLLVYTGCRISEALALTPEHLDVEANTVTFRTLKRRRLTFRMLPVPLELVEMVGSLGTRPGERIWPVHRATAWRQIKALFESIQVSGPMACCRGLRHGFGIRAATCSAPLNLIQRWMGHATPLTTAIYLDAIGDEERSFAERTWSSS